MSIRAISEDDWPALMAVQAACYHAVTPEPLAVLQSKWQSSPQTCLAWAGADNQLLGYVLAYPWDGQTLPELSKVSTPAGGQELYLHDLALAPAARGQGAARALAGQLLQLAKRQGFRRVTLVSIQGSERFWESCGFDATKQPAPASYGGQALVMVQNL